MAMHNGCQIVNHVMDESAAGMTTADLLVFERKVAVCVLARLCVGVATRLGPIAAIGTPQYIK